MIAHGMFQSDSPVRLLTNVAFIVMVIAGQLQSTFASSDAQRSTGTVFNTSGMRSRMCACWARVTHVSRFVAVPVSALL
jgi:hypothetical protein